MRLRSDGWLADLLAGLMLLGDYVLGMAMRPEFSQRLYTMINMWGPPDDTTGGLKDGLGPSGGLESANGARELR
jgi:hypothetical protein